MAKNRKCLLCGTAYSYCPTCPADRNLPKYMVSFDTENCKSVFNTLVSNTVGDLSDSEAKKALSKLDLSRKESYAKDTQKQIDRIMKVSEEKSETRAINAPIQEATKSHKQNFKQKK